MITLSRTLGMITNRIIDKMARTDLSRARARGVRRALMATLIRLLVATIADNNVSTISNSRSNSIRDTTRSRFPLTSISSRNSMNQDGRQMMICGDQL